MTKLITMPHTMATRIEQAKTDAINAARSGDWNAQRKAILFLEENWHDHHAAMRFYTHLESIPLEPLYDPISTTFPYKIKK